jgi:hypothetical protein
MAPDFVPKKPEPHVLKKKKKKNKNIKQNQEENLGDTEENELEENDLITGKKRDKIKL